MGVILEPSPATLELALQYTALGWQIVPCYGAVAPGVCTCFAGAKCNSPGKHPILNAWQDHASSDENTIAGWLEQYHRCNIGVAMGPGSGIIDIECDSPEAEQQILELFDDDFPVTPTFQADRGKHRLFKWSEDVPFPEKAVFKHRDIEFRTGNGGGAQSIFPPSTHGKSGIKYAWKTSFEDCDPAELPASVIAKIVNGCVGDKPATQNGNAAYPRAPWKEMLDKPVIMEGDRDNKMISFANAEVRQIVDAYGIARLDQPDVQAALSMKISAIALTKLSPPIDSPADCHRWLTQAIRFAKTQATSNPSAANFTELGLEYRDGEWWPGLWRVETLDSDPPVVKLYAPFLADGRYVEMPIAKFDTPMGVHAAVFAATRKVLLAKNQREWYRIWNGHKDSIGLKARLIEAAVDLPAPREAKREWTIATAVLEQFRRGRVLDPEIDSHMVDLRGAPATRPDGTVVFKFRRLLQEVNDVDGTVTSKELSDFLTSVGITKDERVMIGGVRHAFKAAKPKSIDKIQAMTGEET